jgi:hypothetical protein
MDGRRVANNTLWWLRDAWGIDTFGPTRVDEHPAGPVRGAAELNRYRPRSRGVRVVVTLLLPPRLGSAVPGVKPTRLPEPGPC